MGEVVQMQDFSTRDSNWGVPKRQESIGESVGLPPWESFWNLGSWRLHFLGTFTQSKHEPEKLGFWLNHSTPHPQVCPRSHVCVFQSNVRVMLSHIKSMGILWFWPWSELTEHLAIDTTIYIWCWDCSIMIQTYSSTQWSTTDMLWLMFWNLHW